MAFNIPNQTSYILQRPQVKQTEWTRPADWITITDTPGEVQFLVSNLLLSAYTIWTTFTRTGSENLYIDWGDGTVDTVTTNTTTNTSHTYTTSGTPCSRGYDTYKIRVYVDAGATITICNQLKPATTTNPNVAVGVLEAYYGDGTILQPSNINYDSGDASKVQFTYLEYVKLPSSLPTPSTFDARFRNCSALAKIVMPTSGLGFNSCLRSFENCFALQSITFPSDATGLTNINGLFIGCRSLTGATFAPNLDSVFSTNSMFLNCGSLTSFQMPTLASCTDYTSMFQACNSLITMNIPGFTSGATTVTTSLMFSNCAALEYIKLPTTVNASSFVANSMFISCSNLKSIILPTNFNASTLANAFQACSTLSSVILPTTMSSLTTLSSTFSTCFALQNLTLPTTVGATIDMASTFINCRGLSSIVIPSGWTITSLASTFSGCFNLTNVTLPTGAQNSLTTMASTFNTCYNLKSVTLPSSMTALTTLASTFSTCSSLTGVTFPSSLNSVTTMGSAFFSCSNLKSVTLPTSMSSLTTTGLVSAFGACSSLKTVILPATVSAALTSYNSTFSTCTSLETVTLPTTQTTAVTNISTMLQNCFGLKTLNNSQYIGNTSTGATVYIDGSIFSNGAYEMTGTADFYCKFSKLDMNGTVSIQSKLTSLRLRNNGTGQYGGSSPQINISYTNLNQAALVQVFNDLPTVTSKTINITGALGAAALTAPERAIATGKGWTITG
jgi:hypothetical protein